MQNKKLMALIELHANLEGDSFNPSKAHQRKSLATTALIQSLMVITKGTNLESETLALIETCEKHLYKD
jgi:hypothetical protein